MIELDKTDNIYKHLVSLGVDEPEIEKQYTRFVSNGVSTVKEFNNYVLSALGLDYYGEIDEKMFEDVVDYYKDIKKNKKLSKTKLNELLKNYSENKTESVKQEILTSQLNEVLMMACAYKLRHIDINLNDLVQTCNIGLMIALDKYSIKNNIAFSDYLGYWVLNTIEKNTLGE